MHFKLGSNSNCVNPGWGFNSKICDLLNAIRTVMELNHGLNILRHNTNGVFGNRSQRSKGISPNGLVVILGT